MGGGLASPKKRPVPPRRRDRAQKVAAVPGYLSFALGVVFLRRQRQLVHPFVDLALFRRPAFRAALLVNLSGDGYIARPVGTTGDLDTESDYDPSGTTSTTTTPTTR